MRNKVCSLYDYDRPRRAFHVVIAIAMSANGIGIEISKRWKRLIDLETRYAV